ncbi:MAG TPA: GDSL-type esterase/lipase family protein [Bacteroidales bacterium]|nr:GDSL-type esterase/lipase family protein [Bacteroidales bacterium]
MKKDNYTNIFSRTVFVMLVLVISFSCSVQAARIACVGNSITYGHGLTDREKQNYPYILQQLLGSKHTVMNFGTSGCTLMKSGNKPYWDDPNFKASTDFDPDIVIIMLGTNDAKPFNWEHKNEFSADYRSLIEHYRSRGAKVYIAIPVPVYGDGNFSIDASVLNNEVVPLIRKIAADNNCPVIDTNKALSGKQEMFPDEVHPDAAGANLIAHTVAEVLIADKI